ncbi:HNH endonuclease [Paracoccus seriniphilus]|uniref:HNH endonuclease n=1 Tax=Paracoccus seriniphilus TaxID=184748 RepID=A0A239PS78_9RHOB|nr:hypothetical protein [Paracoccus seriniphilus]SNT73154.1 hypothetical protein SAMN05444959_104327 [Paracoccus seriniphilus]
MARRTAYTKVKKFDQVRAAHVKDMGDVVFKVFQCFNPECQEIIAVREDTLGEDFEIKCPACGYVHRTGDAQKFYDYELLHTTTNKKIEDGSFEILIDDYVAEAMQYKYCIICNALKPLEAFHKHASRRSGRQGECRLCKTVYNGIKNQTRITDQHREAAQKRRLYLDIAGPGKIDSGQVRKRFDNKCFKCGCDLSDPKEGHLDHTLPVSLLWPLTTDNATLLCGRHNGEKSGRWPSEYYSDAELKRLAISTGVPYETLLGPAHINPDALNALENKVFVDQLLAKYAAYIDEIIKVRNRILKMTGFDFFSVSTSISQSIVEQADKQLGSAAS